MDLSNSAIVAAHPDDELLWFGSLIAQVRRLVICYGEVSTIPERGTQRRELIASYPRDSVEFLDLSEPGLDTGQSEGLHHAALMERLRPVLDGVGTVFTHNPWGEYGHPDHKRNNAVLTGLRQEMGFDLYVTGYVARHRLMEANEALNDGIDGVISLPVSRSEIDPIFELYKSSGCWTWTPHWTWPSQEFFLQLGSRRAFSATAFPFLVFDIASVRSV